MQSIHHDRLSFSANNKYSNPSVNLPYMLHGYLALSKIPLLYIKLLLRLLSPFFAFFLSFTKLKHMPFENLVSKRKKLLRFSLREKINRKVSSFSTSNLSISSRNSRQSQEEPTKKNDRRNSPRLRPISQFFFSRDEEDSLEECPEFSRSSSSTSTYSLQTPVTPSRASSRKRMSAIITSSDGSREDVRAAISIWKERVSELSACECGQSDCLSRFLLELNLAVSNI